jgi:hypothetical protein
LSPGGSVFGSLPATRSGAWKDEDLPGLGFEDLPEVLEKH